MNIKTIILMCLINQVLPNNGLVQLKSSLATSDSPLLMKILQSVDAATSDEHLLEVTLKLLRSLCVCMRETLKAKEDKFNIENNSLESNEPSNSDGKVLDLYRKIYNNTCFNLRQELTNHSNKSIIEEETAFLNHTNCGKEEKNETQNIYDASDKFPTVTTPASSKLENVLFEALIQTKDYHRYRIKRYNLLGKGKLQTKNALQHRIIVILTLHPDVQEMPEKSYDVAEEDLNKTLHTKSPIDIDIIDPKHSKKLVENEEIKKLDNFSDCNILSLYKFLSESDQKNLTKVFKFLRKRETLKIYIEVNIAPNHTDYINDCCNNGTLLPQCNPGFRNDFNTQGEFYSNDSNPNEDENIRIKLKAVHSNYKKTVTKIKNLVKLYEDKLNDTSDKYDSSHSTHRNQHRKEKIFKPNLESTTKQTITIADQVYNENDIQRLVSDSNDPLKLGEVTRAILLLNDFVSKQTTKKVLNFHQVDKKGNYEELAHYQGNTTLPVSSTIDINDYRETILNQNKLDKQYLNQSMNLLPIYKTYTNRKHFIENRLIQNKYISNSHLNFTLGINFPISLAKHKVKHGMQQKSDLKLDMENYVNNSFYNTAMDRAITELSTIDKQGTTIANRRLSSVAHTPKYAVKPTKIAFLLSTKKGKPDSQTRFPDLGVFDKVNRTLQHYNVTNYPILRSTENTLALSVNNIKNLIENISYIDNTEKYLLTQLGTTSDDFKAVKKDLKYKKANRILPLNKLKPLAAISIYDKWREIKNRPNLSKKHKHIESSPLKGVDVVNLRSINVVANSKKELSKNFNSSISKTRGLSEIVLEEKTKKQDNYNIDVTLIPKSNKTYRAPLQYTVFQETTNVSPIHWNKATLNLAPKKLSTVIHKNELVPLQIEPTHIVKKSNVVELITAPTLDVTVDELEQTLKKTVIKEIRNDTTKINNLNPEVSNVVKQVNLNDGVKNNKLEAINKSVLKSSILPFENTIKPMGTGENIRPISPTYEADNNNKIRQRITKPNYFLNNIISGMADKYPVTELMSTNDIKSTMNERTIITGLTNMPYHLRSVRSSEAPQIVTVRGLLDKKNWLPINLEKLEILVQSQSPMTTVLIKNENNFHSNHAILEKRQYQANRIKNIELGIKAVLSEKTTLLNENQTSDVQEIGNIVNEPPGKNQTEYLDKFTESASTISNILETKNNNVTSVKKNMSTINDQRMINEALSYLSQSTKSRSKKKLLLESDANKGTHKKKPLDERLLIATDSSINEPTKDNSRLNIQSHTASMPKFENYVSKYTQNTDALNYLKDSLYTTAISTTFQNGTVPQPTLNYIPSRLSSSHPDVNKKTNFQNNNVNYFETFSPFLATKKNIWTTDSNRVIMGPDKTTKNVNREHASYGTQTITYTTEPLAAIEKQLSGQNPITFGFTKKIIELPEFGLLKRDTVIEHIIERPVVVLNLGNQTLNAYQSISNTTGEPRQNENLYIETSTVKYTIPEISFTTRRNVFNLNLLEPVSSDKAQNHFNGNNTFKTEDMGRNDIFQTESGDGETENILKMKLLQIFGKKFNKTSNDFTLQEKKSSLKTTERDLVKPPLKFPETFFTPEWYTSQTAMTEINAENHSTLYDELIDRSHIKEIILVNESLTPVIEDGKTSVDLVGNINAKGILNSSNAKTKLNSSIAFVHTIRVGGEANKKRIKIAASNYNEKLFEKSKLKLLAAKVLENSVTQRINILNIQTEPTQKALNDIKIKNITFNDVKVRNEIETNDTVTHDKNLNNIIIKDMNWTRKSNVMYDNEDLTKIATILNKLAWKPPPKIKGNNTQNNTMRTMENITISLANITSDGKEPPRMNASTEPWFKSAKNKNVTNFIHKSRKPGALTENLDVDQIQSVYYKNMKTIKENFNSTKNKSAANILEKIYEDVISSSLKKNKQPNNNNSQLDYVSENKNTFQQFKNFKGIKNNLVKVLHAKSELILQKTYNSSKTPSLKSKRLRKVLNHLLEGKKLNKHHRRKEEKLLRKKIKRFKNNHKDVEKNKINANAIKNLTSNPKSNTTTVKVQHSPEKENEQTTIPTRFVDNKAIKTNTLFKTNSTQAISMPIMFNASLESAAKDTRRNFGTSNSDSDLSDQIELISFECESETILPNTTSELNTRVPTPNNVIAMSRFWGMILDETDEIENSSKGSEDQTKPNGIVLKSDVMNLTTIKPNGTDNINNTKVIIISNKSLRIPKNIKVEGAAAQKSNRSRVKEILETIDVIQQSVDQLLHTINDTTLIKEDTTNKILLSSENSYNDKHASTSNVTERTSVTTHLLSENELNKSNKITVSMNDLINTTEATHTVQNIFDSVDDLIQELDDVLTHDTINSTSPYANTNSKTNTGQSDSNTATVSTYTSNTEYEYYTQTITNKREQKVNKGSYLTPTEFTTRNEYFKYIGPLSVNTSTTINAHDFKLDRKTTGFPFMSSTEVGTEIPTAEYQTNEISQTMHEPITEISKIINNTNIDYNVTHDTDKIKIDKNQNRSDETGFYINLNNMNTDKLKLMIPPKSDERFLQENKWTSQIFPMKTIAYNSTDTIIKRETLPKLNTLTIMPNNFTTRTDISKYVSETKEISSEFNNFNATEQPSSIVLINQSRELKSTQQMVKGLSKSSDTLDLSMATSIPNDNIDYAKKYSGIKILNENDIKEKHNDSLNSGPAEITTKPVISKNGTQLLLRTDILNLGEPSKNKGVTIYKANSVFEVTTKISSPVTLNEETLVATKGEEIKSFTLKSKFERTVPFAASTTTEMPVENKFTDAEIEIFKENYIEKSNLYEKIPSTDIFTEKVITKAGDINTNQSFLSASLKRIKIHENNISDNFPILDDENDTTGIVFITDTTKLPIASVSKNKSTLFSATEGSNVTTDIVVVGVDSLNIHDKVTYQQKYNDTQSTLDTVTSHLGLLENTLTAYKSYSLNVKKSGQYEDAVKDKNTRNTSTTRLTSLPTFIDKTYKSEEVTLPYSVAIDAAEIHSTNMTQEEKNKYQKKLNKIIDNSLKEEILSKNIITLPAANMSINKGEEIIISDVLGTSPPVVWNLSTTLQIPMVDYTLKTEMHHIETNYGELYSPQVVSTSNDNVTSMKEEDFILLSTSTEHSEETMSYKEKFGVFKSTLPMVLTSSETAHESLGFTDNPESERFTKKVNGYEDFIGTPHASLYVENVTHIPKKESALITTLQKYRNIQKGNVSDNSNILIANHINTIKNISTDTPNAKTFADKSNQNKSKTIHTILTTWDVDQRTTRAISVEDNSTETRDKEKFNKLFIGDEVTTLDNLYRESYKEQNNAHLNINNASNEKYVIRKKKMTGSDIGINYTTTTGKVPNLSIFGNNRGKAMFTMQQMPFPVNISVPVTLSITTHVSVKDDHITTTSGSNIGMLESSPNTTNTVTFKSKINGHSNDLKRQPLFSTQKLLTEENTDDNSIVSTYTKQPPKSSTFIIKTTGTILSHENLNVLNASVSFVQNSTTAMHMLMDADFAKSLNKDAFTKTVTEKLIYLKTEPTSLSFNIFNKSTATSTATTATVTHEIENFYAIDETTLKFVPKNTMPLKFDTEEINYSDMTTTEANRFLSYVANESYRIHRNSSLIENKKILDTDPLKSIISQYKLKLLNTTKNIIILDSNTREKVLDRSIINKNKTSQAHIDNDLEINKISSKLNVYNNITVNKNAKQLTNLSSMLSLHKENTTHEVTKPCLLLIGHEKNKSRIITNTMESLAVTIKDMPIKDTKLKKNIMFKIKTDISKVIKLEKKAQTNGSKPHKIKSIYYSRDALESSNRNTSNMLHSNNTSKIKFVVKIHDGAKNISYIHTPELTQVKVTKLKPVNKTNIQELLPVSQNKINKFRPYQTNKNRSELNSLDKDYRSLFTNTDVGRFKGEKSVQIYSSRVYRPYSSHTTATAVTKMIKYNTYQPTTKEDLELLNFDNQPLFNTPVHNMDYEKLHHQKQALNSSCTVLRNLKNKFNSAAEFSEVLKAANCTEDEQMINAKDQSNNDLHIKQEINRNEHPPAENNEKTHSIEIDKISNPILEININSPQLGISKDSPPMIEIKGNPLPMEIQRNMFPVVDVNRHALPIEIIKNPSSLLNIHRNSLSMMEIIDPLLIQNNRNSLQMEINKNQAQYNEINRNSQENNGNLSPVGEFNRNMEKNSPILEIKKNQPPMVNIIRHFPLYMEINRNSPPIEINPNGSTIAINRYFRWKPPMIGIARDSPSMIDIDMNSPQMIENSRIARPMVDMGRNSLSIFDINTNAAQIVGLNNNASPKDAINMNWPTLDKVNGTPTMISNDGNSRSIFDMQKNSDPIIGINGNLSPMVNKNRNIYSMVQMSNSPEIIDITRNSLTDGTRNLPQGGDINSPSLVDNNRNYTSVNTSSMNDANRKLPSIDLGNNYRSMLDMVGKSPPIFNPLFNPYSPSMVDIDKNPASMIATSKNSVSVVDNSRNSPVMADINRNFPSMPEMSINSPSMIAKSVNSPSMLEMNRNSPSVVGMDSNSSSMFDMNIKSPTMDSNKNYLSALGMGGSSFSFFDMNRNSPSVFFNRNSPSVFDVNRNSHSVSDMSKNSPSLADMNRNPPSIIDMNRNSPSVDLKDNSHLMLDTSRNLPSIFNMNYSPSLVGMAKDSSSIIDMSRSLPSMVNIIRNPLTISDTNTNSPSIFDINRNYLPSMFDMNRNSPSMVDTRKKSPSMLGNNRNLISMLDMNKKSPSIIDINSNSPSMLDTNRNLASMININSNSPSVLDLNRDSPSMIDINGNSHSILDMNRNLPSMIDINGNSHSVLNMNRNSPRMIDINGNSHSIRDMNRNLPSIIDINSNSPSVLDMSRNSASMMNINRNSPSVLDTNRNSASMININSNSPSVLDTNRNLASMIDINGNSPSRLDKNSNSPSMVDIDRNSASVVDTSRNSPSVVDISKNLSSINSISRNSPSIVVANRNSSTINDRDIKLLRTQQNIPLKNNNPTKETRKIAHPIIESNMIRGPKKLKNKKSNILVQNNKIPFNKDTKRKSHPMVGIHKNTHPPIEINRNVHFNIVTRNFKKTGLQKDAFLNPFRKAISYTAKVASPKLPTKTMKRMKLGIRRKEVMTMNTQDFFSQHRVVTQQNLVRKFTKPKSVIFKPRPIPKFSVLHPKFDSIDKAKRFEHIMRPKPLLLKPKHDEFEEALFKHHRPDTSKWHKNLVHNFQSAGVTRNKVRVNNVLDRPLWHSTSKPKFSKEKINVMRNFLYTADYLKVTRRPIFNEELRIPIDSDSSNDNYKPSAFYHRRTEADDEEITTEAVRTPRSRRTIFFLSPTVTDWWLDDMYLKVRLPLPINSNPGMVFPRRHFAKMDEVADLGALFIDDLLDYKEMLDRGELPLERATSREKGQPLCMEQFYRLLGVCRIPEVGKDRLELPQVRHGTEESEELVVVACRNYFYPIPVKAADRGRLTPGEMQAQLLHAMVDAAGAPPAPRVGLLTSMNRDQWARAREQLIKDEMNRMNLELISRALCILCLDEAGGDRADTDGDTNAMLRAMHGAGTRYHSANRWFDKTVQLIISSDGTVGMCYEHSSAEGVAVVRLAERALARAEVADRPAPPPALLPAPQAMKWNVPTDVQRTIETAARDLDRAISDLDHKVYTYRGYGREFMKSCRTSPDVFIQLALQYAYYKMYGYLVTTYESASLRRFRNGRVDNIRSAHAAALSWAAAMCTAETSPLNDTGEDGQRKVSFNLYGEQKKLELFEEAARKQTSIMEANILGKGIDNHLLGLREAARETLGELPQVFSDATYKQMIEFKLSTSQVTTTTDGTFMGYGAVCSDGYGCSYNPKKDSVIFCISSFTSSSVTNTEAFRQSLEEALDSMKLMFQARKTDN